MPKSKPDLCILCGGSPCECDGGQTKRRAKRSAKPPLKKSSESQSPTSTSVESDRGTEDVFGEIPKATSKFKSKSPSDEDRDLSYFAALRLLRPLLSVESRHRVDEELNPPYPQSIDRRITDWKKSVQRIQPPEENS